jgi:putative ABC transport system ATP-binding protein
VRVGPHVLSELGERERAAFRRANVGYVYQNDNLLPFLTVEENLAFQLALNTDARAEPSDAGELLVRLGLVALAHRVPDQLSGGQRQRVAIARAVVHRPRLLLADEPTGALDPRNAAVVIDLLLEVGQDLGATLVVATHDQAAARRMGRIVELRDGVVSADLMAASRAG